MHRHALGEVAGEAAERCAVHHDARRFHVSDDRHEGALQGLVDGDEVLAQQTVLQRVPKAQRHVRVLGGVGGRLLDRHLVEGPLVAARARHLREGDRRVAEQGLGQVVHAVAAQAAVRGVGHQHGVVVGRDLHVMLFEHDEVVFQVLPDLEDRRVHQNRPQRVDDVFGLELPHLRFARKVEPVAAMQQRDVDGAAGPGGEADADQARAHGVEAVGLGVEGEEAGLTGVGDDRFQRRHRRHGLVGPAQACGGLRRFGLGRGGVHGDAARAGDAAGEGLELHPFQEGHQARVVEVGEAEVVRIVGNRHVLLQGDEGAAQPGVVGVRLQHLAALLLLDLGGAGQKLVQRSVLGEKLRRRLGSDGRHARHVVGAVAHQRLQLDHLVRPDAVALDHRGLVDDLVLHRIEHDDLGRDQLRQVLVRRDDDDLRPSLRRDAGVGRHDVIGLVALLLQAGQAEGAGRLLDVRNLQQEVFRRIAPVGLVVRVEIVSEGVARVVEDHREVGGRAHVLDGLVLGVREQLPQHVAEHLHPARGQPVRPRQRLGGGHAVIGAEDVGRAVDEVEAAVFCEGEGLRHGRHVAPGGRGA